MHVVIFPVFIQCILPYETHELMSSIDCQNYSNNNKILHETKHCYNKKSENQTFKYGFSF